jgi:hypothetical protein
MTIPTIGRIVHYKLSAYEARAINQRRMDCELERQISARYANPICCIGNDAHEGDVFPMMIVRVWGDTPGSAVNGQVFLDGNDVFWVTSVSVGVGPNTFAWPLPIGNTGIAGPAGSPVPPNAIG